MYSERWPGFYFAYDAPKTGQILVFDDETTYGLHVYTKRLRLSPVFTPGAVEKLEASPAKEVLVTDTIPRRDSSPKIRSLSVAPLLGEAILRIHEDRSVSSLFE